ncbi:glyoxalase [Roseivirga sp.]|uniref:glyoxalase n=1 Tax=Roseivirga sp. TaxID=1964215 RepID=UPI003B529D92
MKAQTKSIRPFIGARNYQQSRAFYRDFGFQEVELSTDMCVYKLRDNIAFYLQKYFVKDWVENTMLFLEVENTEEFRLELLQKELVLKYPGVRISEIRNESWGREFFVHDPSTILWHIGEFYT